MKNFTITTVSLLKIASFYFLLLATFTVQAQELMRSFSGYSKKKIAYITMDDGTQIQANLKDFKYKKGLIEAIKLKDIAGGKKQKIKPEKIKHMYVPISGWSKLDAFVDVKTDATQWGKTNLKKDIFEKGYVYFEKSNVKIKKKTRTLLLQLLNPSFSAKVKIYHDPHAKETLGAGIGGIKVAGGHAKSYYIKKGDNTAYKVLKKTYKEEYKMIFEDCSSLVEQIDANRNWVDFVGHIYQYATDCQ